jgi:hypothetical protein
MGVCRCLSIKILSTIQSLGFYLNHQFLKIEFYLCLQVEPTHLNWIDEPNICCWCQDKETSCIYWVKLTTWHLKTEIEISFRNFILNKREDDGNYPEFLYL